MKYLLKDGKVERSRREKEERKREREKERKREREKERKREREKIVDAMRGERRCLMS